MGLRFPRSLLDSAGAYGLIKTSCYLLKAHLSSSRSISNW